MVQWPGFEFKHPCRPFFVEAFFSPSVAVSPSTQKLAFPNFNSVRNGIGEHALFRCAFSESLPIYLYLEVFYAVDMLLTCT